jgi:hypothetical protein
MRGGVLIAVAALTAALMPSPASAATTKILTMSQTFEFGGQKWRETITATDGSTDSVSISLSKAYKKSKDGKLVYNLRETQSWNFSSLNANTVDIASDLTATIDLGAQHPGLFEADIELNAIDGKGIDKSCNGKLKRRTVQKSGDSTMSLHTGNEVFGNVTTIPKRANVIVNSGCTGGGGGGGALTCPGDGEKSVSGNGFNFSGSSKFFNWAGTLGGTNATISMMKQTSPVSGVSLLEMLSGKVAKSRVSVENDLSGGSVDGENLPRLSGKGTVMDAGAQSTSPWTNCGKGKEYRSISKSAPGQGGDLTFTPTGGSSVSSGDVYDMEGGSTTKMDVRNR